MEIILKIYEEKYEEQILNDIKSFFRAHHMEIGEAAARENLANWTSEDHEFYVILGNDQLVGFVHLCMRGPTVCWIEDIFVEEHLRKQGIASKAIELVEEQLQKRNVQSICMDVVPDNLPALKLYHRLGYDQLSIVTVRKDRKPFKTSRTEQIGGIEFRIKQYNE